MNHSMQREAILNELKHRNDHPTAEDLYTALRPKMPRLSLGTVYRNLEQLAAAGMILKLENSGKWRRFDGRTEPHCHRRCFKCGRISDLIAPWTAPLLETLRLQAERYGCVGYQVEFTGLCENCRG